MSGPDESRPDNVASHTLELLCRVDRRLVELDTRFVQIVNILSRQQTRLERIERDVGEIKFDMAIMENNILNRMTDGLFASSRIGDIDDRLTALEQASRNDPSSH